MANVRRSRLPGPRTPFGHLWWGVRMLRQPYGSLWEAYRRWGDVVALGYGPMRYVYLLGRDANEMVLCTRAGDFTWHDAFQSLVPVDGKTALVVSDGEDHARRRRLVQPAFALRRLYAHVPLMEEEARLTMGRWTVGDRVDLYAEMRRTVRRIAVRVLFGDHLAGQADELGKHLQVAIDYANLPPIPGGSLDLPGSPYRRATRARTKADLIISEEVARRRAHPDDDADLLSALVRAQDADGSALTDEELRDQVVSLIAAGYDTTSALVAWALYAVLCHPHVLDALRSEIAAKLGEEPIDVTGLDGCTMLRGVINETLRLYPPAPFSPRKAEVDVSFAGHTVPAGSMILYSQYVTHRLPELWPGPGTFRPERWSDDKGQPVEPVPFSFVPFGGGYRRCIGFALAILEAKVLVTEVLRAHTLRLERGNIRATGLVAMSPKGGVPVTIVS
jgi:cytochrome P450